MNDRVSVWRESVKDADRKPRPALEGDVVTDVLVVGGGLAGVLTAHRLRQAGARCIVVEAKAVGGGATQNTTAKITAQHGLIYADLINRFGMERARQYLEANTRAIGQYRELDGRFPCDFEEKTAYVYAGGKAILEREARAYERLGLPGIIRNNLSLPVKAAGAVVMEGQAQFNPLKLLNALADGLDIYENTLVRAIDGHTAITQKGRVKAKHVVLTTHYPLVNVPGLYFMKLTQSRSYVIALEGAALPDGIYVDEQDGGFSFRTYENLLLLGGGGHKTGQEGGGFAKLRHLAAKAYPDASERFSWSAQDCMSLDDVPYVGRHSAGRARVYVATGFNKWGMTGCMAAAGVLRDLILDGKSRYEALYSPRRSMLTAQLGVNLISAAGNLLSPGGPRCSHLGCKLRRNDAERTWDCPCHGSRFDENGHVIDNPAKRCVRQ